MDSKGGGEGANAPALRRIVQVQVELKKGETIMTDASLHLPPAFLNVAFSKSSGVPLDHFELYYRGKRLEGETALSSWGITKDATIEVKMRGRGGGCVRSKEASAAADRSAKQHPAREVNGDGGGSVEGVEGSGGNGFGNAGGRGIVEAPASSLHRSTSDAEGEPLTLETAPELAIIPPTNLSVVVELHGGFPLETAQVRLLECAFTGCSRVIVTKLHGGFSGSLVLKTDSYGHNGSRDEPTVTKLDDAQSMLEEVAKTMQFTKLVGASAAQVQRGPFLVDASGKPIEANVATGKDFGCVVLDMAGACWVMPEFAGMPETELISTFKQHVLRQLSPQPDLKVSTDVMAVMQELWGAGGPLRSLALETCTRSETLATQPKGLIEGALRGIITSLILAFRVPNGAEDSDLAKGYSTPPLLDGYINKVLESKPGWLTEKWSSKTYGRHAEKFEHSLVHDCDAAVWRNEDTCKALVGLVEQLESLLQPGNPTWLAGYTPLRMHQHGDLNCGNILVDVRNSLWLIDFAKAGEQALFVDAAKMVSVILFEQFPVPLTLEDLGRPGGLQKLVDALGASEAEAKYLASLAKTCDSKAALVEKLALDDMYKRFLPFIEDDAVAEKRAKEACDVIDLLFKPSADGKQPQLWEMGERQPPADWPAYAQLALQLCARVLKVTTELVADCSRREQKTDEAMKEDLHPVQFLLPLLKRALSILRYRDCGSWQKRVAWHAARRLARALSQLLSQPPERPPASAGRVVATKLRLMAGPPIAMLDTAGRLEGGLGQRRLFLVTADKEPSAQHLISDKTEPLEFDQVDQTVLPWQTPSPETVSAILESAQQDLFTTIPALVQTLPSCEVLNNEREQGTEGEAISGLIKRLQQVTPKAQALQDRFQQFVTRAITQIELVFGEDQATVKRLGVKAAEERVKAEVSGQLAGLNLASSDSALNSAQNRLQSDLDRAFIELRSSLSQAIAFDRVPLQNSIEAWAIDQLQCLGALSVRWYAVGQRLLVHQNGAWLEKVVTHADHGSAQHRFKGNSLQLSIALHPWNHAPLVLPLASFEALRSRHTSTLRSQHASIVDALSGQQLDSFDQCVPIKVVTAAEQAGLANMNEVGGLASWLLIAHQTRRDSADSVPAACLLLTAPPAAGKSCLISQLVMHVLQSKECDMVPILIKVQELQRHLLNEANQLIFERSWNWVDAFLQCVHGVGSDLYCMLRQALMARRALLLLDGIDEGGKARDAIERHVTEVLAPQGHVMLVTSRPAGLKESRFSKLFVHVKMEPLSDAQQKEVVIKRLGEGEHSDLLEYLRDPERVPLDLDTQQRITGNPLMLSMVISIFQSKQGTESAMPGTITELYEVASRAMLERVDLKERGAAVSAAAVPHLRKLLEATLFEAHAAEVRDFGDAQLNRAALVLFASDKLKELEQHPGSNLDVAINALPTEAKEALRIVRERVAQDRLPLLTLLESEPLQMQSSHLSFQEYFAVRAICTGKHRLPRDSPPWKWGPFWANVVKLGRENGSQFGAGLLCAAGVEDNELNLSGELGGDRPTVLAVVCSLIGSLRVLDLSSNDLGPEGGVMVAQELKVEGKLMRLDLQNNKIGPDAGVVIAEALEISRSLTSLNISCNQICGLDSNGNGTYTSDGIDAISNALRVSGSLTSLDVSSNRITGDAAHQLATAVLGKQKLEMFSQIPLKQLRANTLSNLDLLGKSIGVPGALVLAELIRTVSDSLTILDVRRNDISGNGASQLAASVLANLNIDRFNNIPVREMRANIFTKLDLSKEYIGVEGGMVVAGLMPVMSSLTSLNLHHNEIGAKGGKVIAEALKVNCSLTECNLKENNLGGEGWSAISEALRDNKELIVKIATLESYRKLLSKDDEVAIWDLEDCEHSERRFPILSVAFRRPGDPPEKGKVATTVPVKGTNPAKVDYYMHVAVQPAPVVTAHLSQRRNFMSEMDGLNDKLQEKCKSWLDEGRYPICLSDAREEILKPQLLAGCVNVLVWCATGTGWEVKANPCPLQLPGIIDAIKQAPVKPRCAVVCLAHGPKKAAEALHSSGVPVVIWVRADLSRVALPLLFEQVILPALEKIQNMRPEHELFRELRVSAEILFGSEPIGYVGDVGASAAWTPDESQRFTWLIDMREQQLTRTNLLACTACGKLPNISPEPLLACDVPLAAKVHEQLLNQRVVSLSPQSDEETLRCRTIAFEACLAHAQTRGHFNTVYRIATRSDLFDAMHCCTIELNKSRAAGDASKVLLWIDGTMLRNERGASEIPPLPELQSFIHAFARKDQQTLCLLLTGGQSDFLSLRNLVVPEHSSVLEAWTMVAPPELADVRADELHDDIRLTALYQDGNSCALLEAFTERSNRSADAELLLKTLSSSESDFLLKALSKTMPPSGSMDRPLAAMYQDDDGALLVRSAITDVALLHEQRDDYLTGKFETRLQVELQKFQASASPVRGAVQVQLDRTRYVEHYEQNILALENLTPHQRKVLKQCKEFTKDGQRRIHVMAPAGAGKTFIALFEMLELLRRPHASTTILFVARSPALSYTVVRWLCARVKPQEHETLLQRLFVLHEATSENTRVRAPLEDVPRTCTLEDGSVIRMTPAKNAPTAFDMVVVDEAHHLYRDDDARAKLNTYTEASNTHVMLLSDVSQSTGTSLEYPADLKTVELTEVVRCSKRIVQAAASFQIGGGAKLDTVCHHESDGPPVKSFLFDLPPGVDDTTRFQLYSEKIVEALDLIIRDFPGLKLQDRVAILVPDHSFCEGLRPQLKLQLERQMLAIFGLGEVPRNFSLTTAADAAAVLIGGQSTAQGKEEIVLDTLAAFDGLERLIVIAVGLDAPLTEGADDMLETRSRMYRALTRAHMLAMVVNESVAGGWLEWLGLVKLEEGAAFDRQAELHRQEKDAAEAAVSKRTKEIAAALEAAMRQRAYGRGHDLTLEGRRSQQIIWKRVDEAVTRGKTAEAAVEASLKLWDEQGAAVQSAFAKHQESNSKASGVKLTLEAKVELQGQLGSKTGEAANLAARTLLENFVADQDKKRRKEEIAELCEAEATLADEKEQQMVAVRATELEGEAKDAVTSALKLLRTKQREVNEEVETVLNAYNTSLLADDLKALRQKVASKVYTDGVGVVEVVAIETRKAVVDATVAAAKLNLSRAAKQWLIGVVIEAVGEGTKAIKAVSESAAQLAEVVGEVKSAFATAELSSVADTAELAVAVLRGDTTVEAEVQKAIVHTAVAVAKLQLSRAAKQWLVEAVTKAVSEGVKVEEAVCSSATCHAELVEEVKAAFTAAELGDHKDVDWVVMTVLRGNTTVDAEVQKVKVGQGKKEEQTVWDTTGNKQSRLLKAEELAFCPMKVQVLTTVKRAAPAHDVDLSKLLSKLLRHEAVELDVAIDTDGWVALSDALAQINGPRLRELVGNTEKLGSRRYTEADVREGVDANDERRFVIDGTEIRAAQGHGMPGIGEKQGEPLTLETAPEVAVHGSYVKHVHAILEQGLSRMGRHHVHLAKGLLGEKGVVSGMRRDAEVFIWVNVHEAIKGGLTFYESANGVILCGGQNGDGIIPPAYFSVVIELHGGMALEPAQVRLLERAFAGCSRVVVTKLHGGFSGSLVLKTDSYGLDGSRDEPTVTKLDDAESMLEEVAKTAQFTKLVGASAAQVQRGPYLVDASGKPIEANAATGKDFGCVVLDMAGACWVMPEFYGKLDTELISTFKQHVVRQLAAQPGPNTDMDVVTVIQELWGAGGPLRVLALETCTRSKTLATQPKGLIEGALRGIITSLILAFRVPNGAEDSDLAKGYSTPPMMDGCISKVLESKPGWLTEKWSSKTYGRHAEKFEHSLVHDCDATVWRNEDTCKALVGLVEQLESLLHPAPEPTWLADYKPLRMHQHGDLNCGNILVDVRSSLWLIDFAKAGEQALFVDAAKMVSVILFEQFPVPLTLEDLRGRGGPQKLVDALGASEDEAEHLAGLATACNSKAALVERLAADDIYQRFLPFIEDNAVAEQRAQEAFDVIDLLFKPGADGKQPQLWEMGERQPPADWPAYAQLALQLCARVLKVTTELVAECSRREQGLDEAMKEDLHPVQFLFPLLKRALSTLRYRDLGSWQKRVAWHAAQGLAGALSQLL